MTDTVTLPPEDLDDEERRVLTHYQGLHSGTEGPYPLRVRRDAAPSTEGTWTVTDPSTDAAIATLHRLDPGSPLWEILAQWIAGTTVRYHEPAPEGLVEDFLCDDWESFSWGPQHQAYLDEVEAYNRAWAASQGRSPE